MALLKSVAPRNYTLNWGAFRKIINYSSTFIITVSLGFSIVKRAGFDQALFPILSIPPDAGTLKKK